MKPLTRKMLESGLIDKHVAVLMERWGQLDHGASDLVGKKQVTAQVLKDFADDLEELLEREPEFKETWLDPTASFPVTVMSIENNVLPTYGYVDSMGQIFVSAPEKPTLKIGDYIHVSEGHHNKYPKTKEEDVEPSRLWVKHQILDIEVLYQGDKIIAARLIVH